LVIQINAKEFVDWLFKPPVKRRMKPVQASEAIAVARILAELANSQSELNFLWDLAAEIWRQLIYLPEGRVATNEQCGRFLDQFGPYFPGHDLKRAQRALEKTAHIKGARISRNSSRLEYRAEKPVPHAPSVVYGPRTSKRPPADDISERIGVAMKAMTEAGCSRPAASVGDALRKAKLLPAPYCTVTHVISRREALRAGKPQSLQEISIWLICYWDSLHPESTLKTAADPEWPESFVFERCNC
jgi:hypothetical protein